MSNVLSSEKQILAVTALAEGSSIRSVERITGIHRDTIMRLGVRVGRACAKLLDEKMRGLELRHIEVDEIWSFVKMKQASVAIGDFRDVGTFYTYVALDTDTRLIPSYYVGRRDYISTTSFIQDLASRVINRPQLSSDGFIGYAEAVEESFGCDIDYGQIVKKIGGNEEDEHEHRRYSPAPVTGITRKVIYGDPIEGEICTSHIEAKNLGIRMFMRRLTRLTNAFSKNFENHCAAFALHFAYYNFCLRHSALRMTPAEAAGVAKTQWSAEDLVELVKR